MNFGFTEEQEMLRAEVRKFLDANAPMRRGAPDHGEPRRLLAANSGRRWRELGWLGLADPRSTGRRRARLGGPDGAARGVRADPVPVAAARVHALRARAAREWQRRAAAERWLPGIADGSRIFVGRRSWKRSDSLGDRQASATRAEREGGVRVLRGEKLLRSRRHRRPTHFRRLRSAPATRPRTSPSRWSSAAPMGVDVEEHPVASTPPSASARCGSTACAFPRTRCSGTRSRHGLARRSPGCSTTAAAAVTAEAIGAAEGGHALIVEYAKQRVQFGSLIGRYQGVKHPLAEMYVDIESFKSLLYYAAWCLDESPDEAPLYVSMAKAWASDAFTRIGIDGIELHGALGLHLGVRRPALSEALQVGEIGTSAARTTTTTASPAREASDGLQADARGRGLPRRGAALPRREPAARVGARRDVRPAVDIS